ncbi:SdpI family protein [Desulfococcaceae bacterium HSG8]|nr:SdpI family protein [Desulfococcaceae bacterium HSG8]
MNSANIIIGITDIFCGLLFIGISIPLLKGEVRMNRFYGIRFAKSFESEENWLKINAYGAKRIILWSVPVIIIGIITLFVPLRDRTWLTILLVHAPLIIIIPAVESYLYARTL